jgi:AraC-like DNA-binding protein/quercetin dioxygenase-like cupin family protein
MRPVRGDLKAQYTVLKMKHELTAKAPVRVVTFADSEMPQELLCGVVKPLDRSITIPPHSHEYYELTLCLDDGGIHETQAGTTLVHRGTVIVLAPGEVHGFRQADTGGRGRTVICDYLAEWLYPDLRGLLDEMEFVSLFLHTAVFREARRMEVPQWHVDEETLEACMRELRDIGLESEGRDPSHSFMRSCLRKAMIRLHRAYKASAAPGRLLAVEPVVRSALLRIEDCILQCTPFRVSVLAEESDLGADCFSKLFKEATGSSPMDHYQHRRLQQACSSLLGTGRTVTEIAQALGYCDAAHFSHIFRRNLGTTPSEYRRNFGG